MSKSADAPGPGRPPFCDWSSVDWSKRNDVIASKVGCSCGAVHTHRKRLGMPKQPVYKRGRPSMIPWASVDWTKQDTVLEKEFGYSRENFRRKRKLLGLPQSPDYCKRNKLIESKFDWASVDWTLQDIEIADLLKCSPSSVFAHRRRAGLPGSPNAHKQRMSRYDWASVDWSLSSYRIAKILGCTQRAVALRRAEFFPK